MFKKIKRIIGDIRCMSNLRKNLNGRVISVGIETDGSYSDVSNVFESLSQLSTSTGCAIVTANQTKKIKPSDLVESGHFTPVQSFKMPDRNACIYGTTTKEHLDATLEQWRNGMRGMYK